MFLGKRQRGNFIYSLNENYGSLKNATSFYLIRLLLLTVYNNQFNILPVFTPPPGSEVYRTQSTNVIFHKNLSRCTVSHSVTSTSADRYKYRQVTSTNYTRGKNTWKFRKHRQQYTCFEANPMTRIFSWPLHPKPTSFGAHPASYQMVTGGEVFRWDKVLHIWILTVHTNRSRGSSDSDWQGKICFSSPRYADRFLGPSSPLFNFLKASGYYMYHLL